MSEPHVPDASQPPEPDQPPDASQPAPDRPRPSAAPGILDEDTNADAIERVSLSSRLRQTRTIVSILIPLAIIGFFVALNRESLSKVPGADRRRRPGPRAGRVHRVLPGLPAARPALGDAAPRDGVPHRGQGLDRDPVPVLAGQLPHPRQAGRRVPRLPAADQQRRVPQPHVRDGVHRADPGHLHDRAAGHRGRVLELPHRPAPGDPGGLRDRDRDRRPPRAWRCSRCATSAGGSSWRCPSRSGSWSSTTGSSRACSAP